MLTKSKRLSLLPYAHLCPPGPTARRSSTRADSFRKDLLAIAAAVPSRRQTIALSATFAPAALDQLRRMMKGRQQELRLCADDTSLLGVRQCYRLIGSGGEQLQAKMAQLLQLLSSVSFQQAVVFCKYTAGGRAWHAGHRLGCEAKEQKGCGPAVRVKLSGPGGRPIGWLACRL